MALFVVLQTLVEGEILLICDFGRVTHHVLNVRFLIFSNKLIDLFLFKRGVPDTVNFLQVKYYGVSEIRSVKFDILVGKLSVSHGKS